MRTLVARLAAQRILVIGDLTLDEYLYGRATRLSREAALPVLELQRQELILGGAANPARNIVALGGQATQIGVVGNDPEAEQLKALLAASGISSAGLVVSAERPTTRKTRILATESPRLPQHVARLDRLQRSPLSPHEEQQILAALAALVPKHQAVLCSDYQLGLLTARVVDAVRELCRAHAALFCVDAQGNSHFYRGADLFRCNDREAALALGLPLRSEAEFVRGLARLRNELNAQLVMVTRGPDGLSLEGVGVAYQHLAAARASEVYDTTGAGDTFVAVATMALTAGLTPLDAAQLANTAAALVVRRYGNAVVSPEELMAALGEGSRE
ncbi:bifunctional heptose 7-phosphate kinase/heptose 1-phosphate adenyltransferase [Candidatus Viridilinea mediisalina]|uniref:Ribokinase n=1 Tax=Candidatus Viridilinea mediisalina TaxID=2024553 RepID=A0A2A6RK67_9CHLR|nr:bifunctional ADP-heptose synthase [Candidatus Viridilinea mediisalina]PDW03422.1 ribokinase [Candidatus Viridilinea mediisalina]